MLIPLTEPATQEPSVDDWLQREVEEGKRVLIESGFKNLARALYSFSLTLSLSLSLSLGIVPRKPDDGPSPFLMSMRMKQSHLPPPPFFFHHAPEKSWSLDPSDKFYTGKLPQDHQTWFP